ncbi:MAG TPA: AMP-binding protein, partial [Methanomassiliicoccaceae archaeon]|nr:AMP-binding protein [Methanomassiliicoccaceae archaeon]
MMDGQITRDVTLGQLLDEAVRRCPDNDAVVYPDRDYRETWKEFSDTVDRVAKGLMALGVQKGEKIA